MSRLVAALSLRAPGSPASSTSSDSRSDSSSVVSKPRLVKIPRDPTLVHAVNFSRFGAPIHEERAFDGFRHQDKLKVVIVGCGFGGLATAIACARQGFAVTVLERGAGLSPHGDAISFGSNAGKLFARWGVGDEMWAKSAKGGWWMIKDKDGKVLAEEDLRSYPREFDAPMLQGHRAQFLGVLGIEARLLMVDIRYETEVAKYFDSSDSPALVTTSGEVIQADVIVVADGVHSRARELLTPRGQAEPTVKCASGYSIHRGAMSSAEVLKDTRCAHLVDGNTRTWIGNDCHAMLYTLDNGAKFAFAITRRDALGAASLSTNWRDRKAIKEVLKDIANWDPALVAAVSHFDSALNWPVLDEAPAPEWISEGGKIVFIGDAVHAMMPTSFQGGSMAIEDAAVLALTLALSGGKASDVGLSLQVYQSLRRPRVAASSAAGRQQQKYWHWHSMAKTSSILTPLTKNFYAFDAEVNTLEHFERVAQMFEDRFEVDPSVRREVDRNTGIKERNFTRSQAENLYRRARKPAR